MADQDYVIGIDLGTSNSCVGVFRNGRVDIIENEQGSRLTPSVVAFTDEERFVGDSAKSQQSENPRNTVNEVKRLIGRKFPDENVQKYIRNWHFRVEDDGGNPKIKVEFRGSEKVLAPEQISAMVLAKLKKIAETRVDCRVNKAVITVPAYFTDAQRQATIDAGTIAGLQVLKIINEPTAAAIAYGQDVGMAEKRNILVFDFGGGTLDVSILSMKKDQYEIKAINGDSNLGGVDLDICLCEHLVKEFQLKTGLDISKNPNACSRIRKIAEQTKIFLSKHTKWRVLIECIHQGRNLDIVVSRPKFEHLCENLFQKAMKCVDDALTYAKLTSDSIENVVLVGGSAWIPKIEQLLQNKFSQEKIKRNINPVEAVAYGAALQAAMLNKDRTVKDITLLEVTAHSLGTAMLGDRMGIIIERNTPIPAKCTRTGTTVQDFQGSIRFVIYEGENPTASKNSYLGEFIAENIEITHKGVARAHVSFELDSNGILNATVVDCKTGGGGHMTISVNKGRLSKEDIDRMVTEMCELQKLEHEQGHL